MNHYYNTAFIRKNKHLNAYERGQIQLLHSKGFPPYAIGKSLGRASNTIRNELKRGTVPQIKGHKEVMVYFPDTGQKVYENNRKNSVSKFKFLKCSEFINYVLDMFFNKEHSLDAISGAARLHGKFTREEMVCTKTLYNYVDAGLLNITNIDLPMKVRRSLKKNRVRKHKKILGKSIDERPEHINERSEFGHWEIDTVIGKRNKLDAVLLTMTERKTRKEIIRVIKSKSSNAVINEMKRLANEVGDSFNKIFKSITADNGSEFSQLVSLEQLFDSKVFFAHPYTSSERGTNERHNGLIRRFIPKGRSINEYCVESIKNIQEWCNTLPRKILNYLTPNEAFEAELESI